MAPAISIGPEALARAAKLRSLAFFAGDLFEADFFAEVFLVVDFFVAGFFAELFAAAEEPEAGLRLVARLERTLAFEELFRFVWVLRLTRCFLGFGGFAPRRPSGALALSRASWPGANERERDRWSRRVRPHAFAGRAV